MPCWPISYRDGIYQVTDSDGILHPITLNRLPVEMFNSGWRAIGLQTGLPPFHLLELRHDGPPETDAVWYMNDELDFMANTLRHFNPGQRTKAVAGLSPLLRDIYDETLCAPQPGVAASTHAFDGINPIFIAEMIGFVVETALSPPDVVMAHRLDGVSAHYTADGTRLSTALLRHSLDVALPEAETEGLMLASPFDAALLAVQEHFEIGGGSIRQLYRFRDPAGPMTLYLLFQQDGAAALYIPAMNTVFAASDGLSGAEVMTTLLSYYACHSDRVVPLYVDEVVQRHAEEVVQPHASEVVQPHAEDILPPPHAEEPASPAEPYGMTDTAPAQVEPAALHEPRETAATPPDEASWLPAADATPAAATPDAALPPKWWKRLFGLGNP